MRGLIFLAGIGLVSLPDPAGAAKWIEVGIADNGVKVFVNADSIASGKSSVQVVQRFVFPKPARRRLALVEQRVVYGCANRTVTTLASTEIDAAGKIRRVEKEKAVPPYRILPGTLPEYVFDALC
jgi:hypothetical protein